MGISKQIFFIFLLVPLFVFHCSCESDETKDSQEVVIEVLSRTIGAEELKAFELAIEPNSAETDSYSIANNEGKIHITANTPVALCRGTYDFLKIDCNSLVSWSGSKINIPEDIPQVNRQVTSPYQFRYYFNVVTHGYTTAYWDWKRWEKEIDWMAWHGINMPLIGGAHEAILYRVFEKLGLTKPEIEAYFSGPAHFPWNRMGNLNGWDGPVPDSYYQKQIDLTHQMLDRMYDLEMTPIIHAFAGFVPKGLKRLYPDVDMRELGWGGGLPLENNAYILSPKSPQFIEIGALYIEEWEKEFGEGEYYLADSFNEMDVPQSPDPEEALAELAMYGESVYKSIKKANPDATWVMQGWTFPYHRDENGKLFWTKERLGSLVSKVPDEKLLILDLANEYNHVFWKIDPSWKMYEGFFGKKWIYSFIPNMGGKVPLNGVLDVYANITVDALEYENKKNLVGFGFAPEGIENNEIIYELLSDVAWSHERIDLDAWIEDYCVQRYGGFPEKMKKAFELLNQSCFGTFTDHPMHRYQFRPYDKPEGVEDHATVHTSQTFEEAVRLFAACTGELGQSDLYTYDAIEMAVQYLGLFADQQLLYFLDKDSTEKHLELKEVMDILLVMDRLLESHPNHKLDNWVNFARLWGDNNKEKDYYEQNAKRLITTWGGDPVNDYSGRVWSGLLRDYYVPRWINYHSDKSDDKKNNMREWEETYIKTPGISSVEPYEDPLKIINEMLNKHHLY